MDENFAVSARQHAQTMNYTEYDAKEMTKRRAEQAGEAIIAHCEEPRIDEVCEMLELSTEDLDVSAQEFTPRDLALAAWSNWGAGSFHRASDRTNLSDGDFVVLNDWFSNIVEMAPDE